MNSAQTFVDVLRARVADHGDRTALVFVHEPADEDDRSESLTYAELDAAARVVAAALTEHVGAGDRVLLPCGPGLGFAVNFVGCVYAGAVAVPVPAPDGYRQQQRRVDAIAHDAEISAVLTDPDSAAGITEWVRSTGLGVPVLAPRASDTPPGEWTRPPVDARSVMFLQYTSGSTSTPRGVVVDNGNFLHNAEALVGGGGVDRDAVFGGWLPMYHDFGLIGTLLIPLYYGVRSVLMPPTAFVKRPYSWLRMIDRHDVTFSPAPDFAYDLCVRRVSDAQLATLDLSRWRHAVNGAEPVQAATVAAFAERFGPAGFRPETMHPGYGLAESTLCVTSARVAQPPVVTAVDVDRLAHDEFVPNARGRALVSSGRPSMCELLVVDPRSHAVLPDGRVGEIWVRSPSVARGYWGDKEGAVFDAATADGDSGYLRTGDLGVLSDGELYVTGRIKEMLIVNGQNIYPHDLERSARSVHSALGEGRGAAFTVAGEHDQQIVVVQECRATRSIAAELGAVAGAVRESLTREYGVAIRDVVLVRPGTVRRTTSGKIQRGAMREQFLAGELDTVYADLAPARA